MIHPMSKPVLAITALALGGTCLSPGDAYVPSGFEKRGTFIIDLVTRKVTLQ